MVHRGVAAVDGPVGGVDARTFRPDAVGVGPVGETVAVLAGLEAREAVPERLLTRAATPDALAERMASWAVVT